MTTCNIDRALIDAFDQDSSPFERALDQLAIGFHTIAMAIGAARSGALPLPQLSAAMQLGTQQLTVARSALILTTGEQAIAKHADAEAWLAGWIVDKLRDPGTDARSIGRIHEDFLEHATAGAIALGSGLHGAWLIRQLIALPARSPSSSGTEDAQLAEAAYALTLGRDHIGSSHELFGARYARYLDRYAKLTEALRARRPTGR